MKPVAPPLLGEDARADAPSLQSEIRELCDRKESERITLPAPPSAEILHLATPVPPDDGPRAPDTIPSPPPSSARRPVQKDGGEDSVPSTIPGPPRLPRIAL
jgi:hypothetical protein